ncbi:hypothetical protein D3C78_1724120 [compost metagenome]
MQVGKGFRGVVARQLYALVCQLLALPAPVAGERRLGHQVGSIGQCAGHRQKAERQTAAQAAGQRGAEG